MGSNGSVPGTASLHLVNGATLLRPEEQVFAGMLSGFANQQLARNLARTTAEGRENTVRVFAAYVNTYPWLWTPAMVDEWLGDLRSLRDLKRSTIRSYSEAVRAFCHFVTDPLYEMGGGVRGAVRHPPGPGRARVEYRGACPGQRVGREEARVHQG